jgi:hypothetical protein
MFDLPDGPNEPTNELAIMVCVSVRSLPTHALAPVRWLRCVLALAIALALLAVVTPGASASLLSGCPSDAAAQPFAPWGDMSWYVPVPGGTFEPQSTPWTATRGAQVVPGNEPWNVAGATDRQSLYLPPGSSATSPAACVGLLDPTVRLFVHSSGNSLLSFLRVDALTPTALGLVVALPVGVVLPSRNWTPTLPYLVLLNLVAPLTSESQIKLRFTPVGGDDWQVDDVYIDPWSKG